MRDCLIAIAALVLSAATVGAQSLPDYQVCTIEGGQLMIGAVDAGVVGRLDTIDFDADFVLADNARNTLSLVRTDPFSFQRVDCERAVAVSTLTEIAPRDVDLLFSDDDLNPDIAVTGLSRSAIYFGDGMGGADGSGREVGDVDDGSAIVAADIDGDGLTDLVVGTVGANNVEVLLADTNARPLLPLDVGKTVVDLGVSDFDGDGRLDVMVLASNEVQLFRQLPPTGTPSTETPTPGPGATPTPSADQLFGARESVLPQDVDLQLEELVVAWDGLGRLTLSALGAEESCLSAAFGEITPGGCRSSGRGALRARASRPTSELLRGLQPLQALRRYSSRLGGSAPGGGEPTSERMFSRVYSSSPQVSPQIRRVASSSLAASHCTFSFGRKASRWSASRGFEAAGLEAHQAEREGAFGHHHHQGAVREGHDRLLDPDLDLHHLGPEVRDAEAEPQPRAARCSGARRPLPPGWPLRTAKACMISKRPALELEDLVAGRQARDAAGHQPLEAVPTHSPAEPLLAAGVVVAHPREGEAQLPGTRLELIAAEEDHLSRVRFDDDGDVLALPVLRVHEQSPGTEGHSLPHRVLRGSSLPALAGRRSGRVVPGLPVASTTTGPEEDEERERSPHGRRVPYPPRWGQAGAFPSASREHRRGG